MTKKRGYDQFEIRVSNPYDPPRIDPKHPGWHNAIREQYPLDHNDLYYWAHFYPSTKNDSVVDVSFRCDTKPAVVVETLRRIADLIQHRSDDLLPSDVRKYGFNGGLIVKADGEMDIVYCDDEDAPEAIPQSVLDVVG
jgi:hypothetical protein